VILVFVGCCQATKDKKEESPNQALVKIATNAKVRYEQGENCTREAKEFCQKYAIGEQEIKVGGRDRIIYAFNTTDNLISADEPFVTVEGGIVAIEISHPNDVVDAETYYASGMIISFYPKRENYPFAAIEGRAFRWYMIEFSYNQWGKRDYAFLEVTITGEYPPNKVKEEL